MKILIVAPYYYPNINPRAHRWTSIAEYWSAKGHDIHLLTSQHKDFSDFHEHNSVKVYRRGFNSLKDILYNFSTTPKRGEPQQQGKANSKKGAFLQWANDNILRKLYFPDDAFTWYLPARRKAYDLLQNNHFDLLITVGIPFTSHLIGLYLKKKFGALKWIADTGDPFAFQPIHPLNNYFLYGHLNKNLEKKVAQSADFVTITNQGAQNLYEKEFPACKGKFPIIPPLVRSLHSKSSSLKRKDDFIKIGYFGSFFKKVREPRPVLQYFSDLLSDFPQLSTRLRLHFYGNIFENFLKDFAAFPELNTVLNIHGLVDSTQSAIEMQGMDILLNVGNATDFQLPSKSVDYLLSGKPILNFTSIQNDTFNDFFKNHPAFESFSTSKRETTRLATTIERFQCNAADTSLFVMQKQTLYTVENIAEQYLSLVKNSHS